MVKIVHLVFETVVPSLGKVNFLVKQAKLSGIFRFHPMWSTDVELVCPFPIVIFDIWNSFILGGREKTSTKHFQNV